MVAFPSSFRCALLAGSAACIAVPAAAEDALDSQRDYLGAAIVVTGERDSYESDDGSSGMKTDTPIIDVPQAMTVITADQIEDQGVTTLIDALRFVPGISVESGEGHRDAVFIRGQSTTADFFVDGVRDDAEYYRSLYNVERVEVLKGPNALIFGRGGGGGAINRVSKTASLREFFGELSGQIGSFGDFALAADINQPLTDMVGLRLNATYEEFDSNRQFYAGRFFGISPSLTVALGPDTRFYASYTYDDDSRTTDRGVPSLGNGPLEGYYDTLFGDPDFNQATSQAHIARARIEHDFSAALSANATVQYANYDKYYANIIPSGATPTTATLSGYDSATQRENLFAQVNLVATFDTGTIGHTLLVGAEMGDQSTYARRGLARFDNGAGGTATSVVVPLAQTIAVPNFSLVPQRESDAALTTASFYIQQQIDFGIVQLVGGVRYDRFDLATNDIAGGFSNARVDQGWSPRFGVIVKPVEELSLYASYSESFLPQSGDQFSSLDPVRENLEPEGFTNYEIGVKWAPLPAMLLSAALFRLDRTNTRAPDPANPALTTLAGATRVEGFEVSVAGEVLPDLSVNLSYTYLDGEVRADTTAAPAGTRLMQLPESQVGAWARYDVSETFGFGAGLVYQSEQFASLSNTVIMPAYTRVDAAIFYEPTETLALQLNVENLFDAEYYPSAHGDGAILPGTPFNATVGARLRF